MPDDSYPGGQRESIVSRRRLLAATGTVSIAGLAGCAQLGGGGDGNGGGKSTNSPTTTATTTTTETATPTETTTTTETTATPGSDEYDTEDRGTIAEDAVDELAILGWTSEVTKAATGNEGFVVTLVIENRGDKETDLQEYNWELTYYDESGSTLAQGRAAGMIMGGATPAGETSEIELWLHRFENPDAVASYDVALNCRFADDAVYCE